LLIVIFKQSNFILLRPSLQINNKEAL